MQSNKNFEGPVEFIEISHVDGQLIHRNYNASFIKSQWQAHFMQIFPLNMSNLPATHPSDKGFFEKHWEGDNHTTYEQFVARGMK